MAKFTLNELMALTIACGVVYGGCSAQRRSNCEGTRAYCYDTQVALQTALTTWLSKNPSRRRPIFRDFCINTQGNVVPCPSQRSQESRDPEAQATDVRLANRAIAESFGPDPKPYNFLCPERRDRIGLDRLFAPFEVHFRLVDNTPGQAHPTMKAICIYYAHGAGISHVERLFALVRTLVLMVLGVFAMIWVLSINSQPQVSREAPNVPARME